MGICEKDGFKFHDGLLSNYIVIEKSRLSDYIHYINSTRIECVSINDLFYKDNNLDFFEHIQKIRNIIINSHLVINYSALSTHREIEEAVFDEANGLIDLSWFPQMKFVSFFYNKNIIGIEKCSSVNRAIIRRFKPKSGNLDSLRLWTKLTDLSLVQPTLVSFDGIEDVKGLNRLELNNCRFEFSVEGIAKLVPWLKILEIDSCKKIQNIEAVTNLSNIEHLAVDNIGEIPSLKFIKKMKKLKRITFVNTNVLDGDLSPCIGLEYVGFLDKKHYSHSRRDFGL